MQRGVAVETDPDPPVLDLEADEHPLADNYRLWARFTLESIWFHPRQRGLAVHLMRREPDLEIPEEKPME